MKIKVKRLVKKILFLTTSILTGLFIFIMLFSLGINKTLLTPEFHSSLFVKNDIYSHVYKIMATSLNGFSESIKKVPTENSEQQSKILDVLEKSVTPNMVKTNIDNLNNGIFMYLNGQRDFLPDISFDVNEKISNKELIIKSQNDLLASDALGKIKKINLNALLVYINRTDIIDAFQVMKLLFYLISLMPSFSLLSVLLLFLLGLVLSKSFLHIVRWCSITFLTSSIVSFISGVFIILYNNFMLENNIYPVSMSIPLEKNIILSYIKDCTVPLSIGLIIFSAICLFLFFIMFSIHKLPRLNFIRTKFISISRVSKTKPILKYTLYAVLLIFILTTFIYKIYSINKNFSSEDFAYIINKIKMNNAVTHVIAAQNDTIYTLSLKIIDKETQKSVQGLKTFVSGKSDDDKKNYYEVATTDETGITKFSLAKGAFRVAFLDDYFPSDYQIPSPYFLELKKPGNTIVTITLDPTTSIIKQEWGIAEIEVLDNNNKVVPDLQLKTLGEVWAQGNPNSVYSITNEEGIAVFKLNTGSCQIGFSEDNFPFKFVLPSKFKITISPNSISRYTIRLSAKSKNK